MRADVAAAERVLEQHAQRELERLSRAVTELESLALTLARQVRCSKRGLAGTSDFVPLPSHNRVRLTAAVR